MLKWGVPPGRVLLSRKWVVGSLKVVFVWK